MPRSPARRPRSIANSYRRATWSLPVVTQLVLSKSRIRPEAVQTGGERGIRTLDTVSRIHAFQACAFNHSATSPRRPGLPRRAADLVDIGPDSKPAKAAIFPSPAAGAAIDAPSHSRA